MRGGHADLDDLDAQLVVEISHAQHFGPKALGRGQRVHANRCTHILRQNNRNNGFEIAITSDQKLCLLFCLIFQEESRRFGENGILHWNLHNLSFRLVPV